MTTRVLTRRGVEPIVDSPPPSKRTPAGVLLQATWVSVVGYSMWAAAAAPEHPALPPVIEALSLLVGWSILIATAGLLFRMRWALWLSVGLALPMVGLAVMCLVADAGSHWIAEAGFAVGITVLSLHPASWRMHSR